MSKYKTIIGLEMHCEISETKTKLFSRAENSYKETPNSNISEIDLAFPGTLPVLNKEAVKKALMASIILGCKQPEYMYFERKNYYYPDLPKGFQITQETKPCPIGIYGSIKYYFDGEEKTALVNNIHLEEDAASLDHYGTFSTINYNRAGVPLLELVTEPCFHQADEAVAFLETMRQIYQYAGISEADSKKGQVRCDVNISIMEENLDEKDPKNYGTRIEIKNVNSFGGVKDAINYEIKRQTKLKEDGTYGEMEQQTRRWDADESKTVYMRSKADAIDYKYFIEPNIPKYRITDALIESVRKTIPVLPNERIEKYMSEYGLSLIDATTLVKDKKTSDYFEELLSFKISAKEASKWMTTVLLGTVNKLDKTLETIYLTAETLSTLINMVIEGKISLINAKSVLYRAIEENKNPIKIIEDENLTQIEDTDALVEMVKEAILENEETVKEYLNGRENSANYLVGCVMKKSKGQANPLKTFELVKTELEKRK